jgi:hypothetical protein
MLQGESGRLPVFSGVSGTVRHRSLPTRRHCDELSSLGDRFKTPAVPIELTTLVLVRHQAHGPHDHSHYA